MKTRIIIGVLIIAIIIIIIFIFNPGLLGKIKFFIKGDVIEDRGASTTYTGEEEAIEKVYSSYLKAGKDCDIDLAYSIITEKSKEIIHYTCSNLENETKCYRGRDYEIIINGDDAVLYLTPFSHQIENPFFFSKENGEWKLNFYKMWAGLVMAGSTCNSGWGWRNQELADEFCDYFEEGQCPDK